MATVEEMIADCAEGFYVHRLSDMHSIDLPSGTVTGTTRDGCFFIKHGKLERPAKNFWFLESPVLAFNRVIHVGQSRRVALGPDPRLGYALSHTPPHGRFTRWPRLPISAPALMIQDWNFNALADAV
jgi:predicted Zn-dependent protease